MTDPTYVSGNKTYFPSTLVDVDGRTDDDPTLESDPVKNRHGTAWMLVRTENADADAETTVTLQTSFDGSSWSDVGDSVVVTENDEETVVRAPLASQVRATVDVADLDTGGVSADVHVSVHTL